MKLTREAIQRMISQKQGTSNVTVINQGGGGGGGVTLGPLLTSLNAEAMPTAEGYLHWTGSAWAFDPINLTPYAQTTWVQQNYATISQLNEKQNIIHFINTKNDNTEVWFSYLHLPLSSVNDGHANLDLSDYATTSQLQNTQQILVALIQQEQMEIGAVPSDLLPTSGSAHWVTSGGVAQMVYVDGFYQETDINIEDYTANAKFIDSSGVWAQQVLTNPERFARSSNIPINGATKVRIKANATNGSIYAFLKSNTSIGSTADFCSGYGTRYVLSASEEVEVAFPSDCELLYIFRVTAPGDNFIPSEITFITESAGTVPVNQVARENQENIRYLNNTLYGGEEKGVALPSSLIRQNFINSSNVWNSDFSTYLMGEYRHVLLPVSIGTRYRLTSSDRIAIYAFLTGEEILGTPSFVTGYEQRYTIQAESSAEITIPNGCSYLYLYAGPPTANFLPTVEQLTNTTGLATTKTPVYRKFGYKKGVMMGDSISAGVCSYFYNNNRYNDFFESNNISDYIAAFAGCQVDNIAKRGTGYVADTRNINNAWEMAQVTDYSQYDFAVLYYGVNDYIQGVSVGSLEVNAVNTIVGNMTRTFTKILTDNPNCKILCVGSYNCWGQVSVGGDYTSNVLYGDDTTDYALGSAINGNTLQDILDAQKEVCEHYHIEFVNFAESGVVNRINIKNILIDGLHPSFDARKLIASEIVKHL